MSFANSAKFILGLSLVVLGTNGDKVASFIDTCAINDDDCMLKSSLKVLPYIVNGNNELGISSADPMHMDHVKSDTGELKLHFDNLVIVGASKCKLTKVVRPTQFSAGLEADCPISANGNYNITGSVLNILVYGKDKFEFETDNIRIKITITLEKTVGKDGQDYYKISKYDYTYDPIGKVVIIFHKLYDGDEEKAAPINALMKENGKDFLVTLGKEVIAEIIKKYVKVVNQLFAAVPASQIDKE